MVWYLFDNYLRTNVREINKFKRAYLFYALREIDNAIVSLEIEGTGAVIAGIEANNVLSNIISMESGNELMQEARQKLAYNAACARHVKTHAKRQEVIDYWHEHIYVNNPKLSNEKAGDWLKDTFPELSTRKLIEYVALAKKKMKTSPPAGKV